MATETKAKKTPAKAKKAADAPVAKAKPAAGETAQSNALQKRRTAVGTVMSDKMQKTIVVRVDRKVQHKEYGKYIAKSRRFKAHDEKNEARIGDRVILVESRPLSRDKRWALKEIIRRAGLAPEANV